MLQISLLTLGILGLLMFLGWGVNRLTPLRKEKWSVPWWGVCLVVLLSGALSLANIPMKYGSYAVLFCASLINIFALIKYGWSSKWSMSDWRLLLFVTGVIVFYLYPMWGKVGYPTTLSLGNLDPVTYASGGEFLREYSLIQGSAIDMQHPYTWSIADILHYGFRYGVPLTLSFFAVILHQQVYQVYTILLAVLTALTLPLIYLLSKKLLGRDDIRLLVGTTLLFGLNSTLMYWQFHAFMPQFVYGGLIVLTILLALGDSPGKAWWMGVTIATTSSVYPDGMMLLLLPLLLTQYKNIWISISYALALTPITMVNSVNQIIRLIKVTTNTTFIGWERIRFGSLWELLGIYNLNYSRDLPLIVDLIVSLPLLLIAVWGFAKIKQKKLIGAYILVFGVFLVFYRLIISNYFVYNRVLGYGMFLLVVLVSIGLAQIKSYKISIVVMVILGVLTLRSSYRTMIQYFNHHRLVGREIAELQNLPIQESPIYNTDVMTEGYDLWQRVWEEHFLREVPFYTRANLPLTGRGDGPFVTLHNTPENGYELINVDKLMLAKDLQ
ncbi:MAG: hypothetical protein ABII21_04355 [bacterium]